ncbi:MAG: DUF1232 domain-containing protein [Anaerolineae bacterium]|nr:DUF1232 domain-containing protein [Anaerolineae bacterium]
MAGPQRPPTNPDALARLWNNMVLAWRLMFDRRVRGSAKLIPVVMLAYILSPIDLIPDILLPFGVVDDLGAFLLGLQLFIHSAPPDVVDEYRQRVARKRRGHFRPDEPKVIDAEYEVRDDEDA